MASTDSEIPPNLLLNPRAKAVNIDSAPLSKLSPTTTNPTSDTNDASTSELRFSPEEEASLLDESITHKLTGNKFFTASPPDYESAITEYKTALAICPKYLHNERSIYYANIAACWLKLEKWKDAEENATLSLVESGDELPVKKPKAVKSREETVKKDGEHAGDVKSEENEEEEIELVKQPLRNHKALLRRARAREQLDTWSSLQNSLTDYKLLAASATSLPVADQKTVRLALVRLPAAVDKKKDLEVAEMMGKLRALGDGILKPFGLSTDNFGMKKDETSGGYSMSFNNGGKK